MSISSPSPVTPISTPEIKKVFGRYTLFAGILLLLLGFAGFFLPSFASLATDVMIATLLIIGGVSWGFHAISHNPKNILNWLKPILLIGSGIIMLLFPAASIEVLALWLAAFLLLAAMILLNWPGISAWIVGIYVSISLVFDGVALLAVRSSVNQAGNTSKA